MSSTIFCCEFCAELGIQGLRWVGDFVTKCLIPGGYKPLKIQSNMKELCHRSGLKNSTKVASIDYPDYDELLRSNIIVNPKFSKGTIGWSGVGCSLSVLNYHESSYIAPCLHSYRCPGYLRQSTYPCMLTSTFSSYRCPGYLRFDLFFLSIRMATVNLKLRSDFGAIKVEMLNFQKTAEEEFKVWTLRNSSSPDILSDRLLPPTGLSC